MSSPDGLMRQMIGDGKSPDDAASAALLEALGEQVLAEIGESRREWLYGLVLREARSIEGQISSRRMRKVLGGKGALKVGSQHHAAATEKLKATVYHGADGVRILWPEMSLELIEAKIALLRKQVGALVDHIGILEAARKLLVEREADTLADVPDWPVLVRKMVDEGRAA